VPELPEIVYTSLPCHPDRLLREMFRDLRASRELAWRVIDTIAHQTKADGKKQAAIGYEMFIYPL